MQIDVFALGKELESYIPGIKVEALTIPVPKFSVHIGEYDDEKKRVRLNLWEGATRSDALAILAHEYAHLKPGTTQIEMGLTETQVWQRGEEYAKKWGVLPDYLRLGRELVSFYEARGLYPGLSRGMRKWLETRGGNPMAKTSEIPREELTKFAIKLAAAMRGQAAGVISVPKLKGWTKEELEGTANLLLKDLRENRPDALGRLQKLYEETNGEPFEEVHYGG